MLISRYLLSLISLDIIILPFVSPGTVAVQTREFNSQTFIVNIKAALTIRTVTSTS